MIYTPLFHQERANHAARALHIPSLHPALPNLKLRCRRLEALVSQGVQEVEQSLLLVGQCQQTAFKRQGQVELLPIGK